jgi:hypothetical protein
MPRHHKLLSAAELRNVERKAARARTSLRRNGEVTLSEREIDALLYEVRGLRRSQQVRQQNERLVRGRR